ncbi:hypothetical protein GCM10009092_29330 [Bowmanella denitrificans]|uniref:Uncharacterized protein n=1 Tax=Bowmanella denitrificans TaxID=366582 RepID=A0ABP3H635_9ALTE
MFRFLVFSSMLVASTFSAHAKGDCDISGIWNHSAKPAKLLIDLDKAEATVYSHDNNKKAIGLVVLKGVMPTSNSSLWDAQMYSAADDSFVDVQITSKGCNQLIVSFDGAEVLGLVR